MRSSVAAFRGRIRLGHVLHHHVARLKAPDEKRPLIANHGRKPVIFMKGVSGGTRARLLAKSEINPTDYFALLVEVLQGLLHPAVEDHPAINLNALLFVE